MRYHYTVHTGDGRKIGSVTIDRPWAWIALNKWRIRNPRHQHLDIILVARF